MAGKPVYLTEKEAVLIHEFIGQAMESDVEGHMARDGQSLMTKLSKAFGLPVPVTPAEWEN